jgi:hypothetical protein
MALVNPNIAMSFRGVEIPQQNALADYAAIQQIQGGRQAQELNALKMQEAQAALTERNALRQLNPTAADYESQLFRVNPTLGIAYRKERSAADASAAQIAASQAAAAKSGFDLKAAQRKFGDDLKRSLSSNPSDENIIAFGQDAVLQGLYTPDQVNTTVSQLLALPLPDRTRVLSQAGASASELKPTLTPQTLGGTTRLISTPAFGGAATQVVGSEGTVTMTPAQEREAKDSATRIKQEGQRIGLEARRVGVMEQNAARDKDPVFQQQMAAAKATGTAIAQGDVKAAQALPKIISDGQMAIDLVDKMVGKQEVKDTSGKVIQAATAPHPGFSDAVGATWKPGFRFIPGTDAATFQTFQDQIEGTAFLSAFEALKGGGAISEKEGAKATAARLRMKTASDEKGYMDAAREFQEVVRKGVETARRRAPGAGSGGAGGTNIDALLDKYK